MKTIKMDKEITRQFWIQISFIAIAVCIGLFIVLTAETGVNDKKGPVQFYDSSVAAWQMPEYREGIAEAVITYYTNRVEETDSTPNITASGQRVRDGIVANNCLKFGALIEYNGRMYEVQDRMNSRYSCSHIDIFTFDLEFAQKFGSKVEEVRVFEPYY